MITILSEGIYQSPRYELPGVGSFLLQGAVVGALLMYLYPVIGLLSVGAYYGYLVVGALPWFLAIGIGFGLLEGAIIWACTFLTGHRLKVLLRAALGVVILALLLMAEYFLFVEPSPYDEDVSAASYLSAIGIYSACGVIFGLVIGSRFDPLYELIRGTTSPRWGCLTAITGFVLRISVILSLMGSALVLIWMLEGGAAHRELTFSVIAVSHFTVAAVILFARMPFWILLPLAIIVNVPIVLFITHVLSEDAVETRVLTLIYLHLWAAFLLCRMSVPHKEQCNENRNNWRYWFRRQSPDNSTR